MVNIQPKFALALVIVASVLIIGAVALVTWWFVDSTEPSVPGEELHAQNWTSLNIGGKYPSNESDSEFSSWNNRLSALPHNIEVYPIHTLQPLQSLPSQFYYRSCDLVPIQNQGECNTCSIFACWSMMANRISLTSGGEPEMLSVQQFLDCTEHDCSKPMPITEPLRFASSVGVVHAKMYPYEMKTGSTCGTSLDPKFNTRVFANDIQSISPHNKFQVGDANHLSCIERAKTDIYSFGPIVTVIKIFNDLLNKYRATAQDTSAGRFTGAIYSPSPGAKFIGYHAIMIVGWIHPNGGNNFTNACWACVSSWGAAWPPSPWPNWNGLFFVQMGQNTCEIESQMVTCHPVQVTLNT